jgi:hypothetical protein
LQKINCRLPRLRAFYNYLKKSLERKEISVYNVANEICIEDISAVLSTIDLKFGSGSLYRKIVSPKKFDRKAILPKHYLNEHCLTEGCLTESEFYRKKSFDRKQNLSKGRLTENIWKMVI